jgi:chemotaxis protein methyltransferase CheR
MATVLSEPLMQAFSDFLASRIGLSFPPPRWPDMLRGLARAAPALGFSEAESCVRWLMRSELSRPQVEILASELSVGETYFFREPATFAALENEILPPLIAARRATGRRLRLWSAGCCTGEEPYSLAILLSRLIPDLADWNVSILGTDINPRFLAKAKRGIYREWSFRTAPAWLKADCFETPEPGTYALKERFKRLVNFDYLNLAEDVYPSIDNNTNSIDVILCRNVLMYFEAGIAAAVARKLHRALVDGGWLIVGPAETSPTVFPQYSTVQFEDVIVYRKVSPPEPAWAIGATDGSVRSPRPEALASPAPAAPVAGATPYESALAAYAQGAYERVAALLADAGDDPRSLALLARASANQGRLPDAKRWCEAAVAADKSNPGLRYLLASILEEQGLHEPAIGALKQALYLDQDFVLAHFALGNLHRRLDHPALSRKHFATARQLLRRLPPEAALRASEGMTAGRLGEIIDASEGEGLA